MSWLVSEINEGFLAKNLSGALRHASSLTLTLSAMLSSAPCPRAKSTAPGHFKQSPQRSLQRQEEELLKLFTDCPTVKAINTARPYS